MDLVLTTQDGLEIHVLGAGILSQSGMIPGADPLGEVIGRDGYSSTVYLDLSKARFIDSSGMAWLLDRHKAFKAAGGSLVIHSVPPLIRQALEMLRLQRVLKIEPAAPVRKADGGAE